MRSCSGTLFTPARSTKEFVVTQLEQRGIETFLPLISEVHRWSDRRKVVRLPLLSCYAFVHIRLLPELWYKVTQTNGVVRFVGSRGEGIPIPDSQIENIRALLSSDVPTHSIRSCKSVNGSESVMVRWTASRAY